MNEEKNYRMERIERLLDELRYEITRGMLEREIDESLELTWIVGASGQIPNGSVLCQFKTRPVTKEQLFFSNIGIPKLKVVGGQDHE